MDSFEIVVSPSTLILAFFILLCVPVCIFCFWQLLPRMSNASRRLAIGMLTSQALVIVVGMNYTHVSDYESWLWHLDREFNIQSAVASTQLALVAGVALVTAWLARAVPAWQRFFMAGIGVIFLHFARDEFFSFHEFIRNWEVQYAALGAGIVIGTVIVAARSPRHTWKWHICLIAGLAMSAGGAILIERLPTQIPVRICGDLGLLRLDTCLFTFKIEETLEFLGIWLVLVGMLGQLSDAAPKPHYVIRYLLYVFPMLWILLLLRPSLIDFLEYRFIAQPAMIEYESDVTLEAYRIDKGKSRFILQIFALAGRSSAYDSMGFSVHLVDQVSGDTVAATDEYASTRFC